MSSDDGELTQQCPLGYCCVLWGHGHCAHSWIFALVLVLVPAACGWHQWTHLHHWIWPQYHRSSVGCWRLCCHYCYYWGQWYHSKRTSVLVGSIEAHALSLQRTVHHHHLLLLLLLFPLAALHACQLFLDQIQDCLTNERVSSNVDSNDLLVFLIVPLYVFRCLFLMKLLLALRPWQIKKHAYKYEKTWLF